MSIKIEAKPVITEMQNVRADCFPKKTQNALPLEYMRVATAMLRALKAAYMSFFLMRSIDEIGICFKKNTETKANFISTPHR